MDRYIAALYKIVAVGSKSNSYKFALWRALASLAPSTDERSPKISKRDLSPLFLGYYWPLQVKYYIRQGTDPDKDPIVMGLIRQLAKDGKITQGETLKNFQKRMPKEHKMLLDRVARQAFDDVIPRFHTVRRAVGPVVHLPQNAAGLLILILVESLGFFPQLAELIAADEAFV